MELRDILYLKMGVDQAALHGKTAVVTGGAMGIGKQAALGLAHLGADVAIIDREATKALWKWQ